MLGFVIVFEQKGLYCVDKYYIEIFQLVLSNYFKKLKKMVIKLLFLFGFGYVLEVYKDGVRDFQDFGFGNLVLIKKIKFLKVS